MRCIPNILSVGVGKPRRLGNRRPPNRIDDDLGATVVAERHWQDDVYPPSNTASGNEFGAKRSTAQLTLIFLGPPLTEAATDPGDAILFVRRMVSKPPVGV